VPGAEPRWLGEVLSKRFRSVGSPLQAWSKNAFRFGPAANRLASRNSSASFLFPDFMGYVNDSSTYTCAVPSKKVWMKSKNIAPSDPDSIYVP